MKKIYSKTFGKDVEVEEKTWTIAKHYIKNNEEKAILLALDIDLHVFRQGEGRWESMAKVLGNKTII